MKDDAGDRQNMTTFPRTFVPLDADLGNWSQIEPLFKRLLEREIGSPAVLERWLLDHSELMACISEERSERYIAMTCDTRDKDKEQAYLHFLENIAPRCKPYVHALNEWYVACAHRARLDAGRYGVLDREVEAEIEIYREENIPLQTEVAKLAQQYQKITGAMTVEYRGEERTLPQMAKFLEETDRSVRQEAWELVAARRLQDREAMDEVFDKQRQLRQQIAANADFADYRGYAFKSMMRFDYGIEDAERFQGTVQELVVPLARELNATQLKLLQSPPPQAGERTAPAGPPATGTAEATARDAEVEALRPWDLDVDPLGRGPLRPFESSDDLAEGAQKIFARLDPELEALFASMRAAGELDLDSRKGKAPGGYMSTRDEKRRPFIFMNAAGLQRDVETLLHEAGHAFHAFATQNEPLVGYRHSPIEFAEVASMSMELFAADQLGVFYSPADAARAKRKHLEGIIRILPWIAQIDAFQHWIYAHPGPDREQRTTRWLELDEAFGPAVDWSGYEASRASHWQRQLHLFVHPFYYIEYGIAQLGALQLWLRFKQDQGAALGGYRSALALGGSRPLPELFAAAGARFDFSAATIKPLVDAVQEELAGLPA
jgi:oligoendopeptidase F